MWPVEGLQEGRGGQISGGGSGTGGQISKWIQIFLEVFKPVNVDNGQKLRRHVVQRNPAKCVK